MSVFHLSSYCSMRIWNILCFWAVLKVTIYPSYGSIIDVKYIATPSHVSLYCINYTYTSGGNSAINCALGVLRLSTYGHGFVYRHGTCHACRTRDAVGDISLGEYMLSGQHYIKSKVSFPTYGRVSMNYIAMIFLQTFNDMFFNSLRPKDAVMRR